MVLESYIFASVVLITGMAMCAVLPEIDVYEDPEFVEGPFFYDGDGCHAVYEIPITRNPTKPAYTSGYV